MSSVNVKIIITLLKMFANVAYHKLIPTKKNFQDFIQAPFEDISDFLQDVFKIKKG